MLWHHKAEGRTMSKIWQKAISIWNPVGLASVECYIRQLPCLGIFCCRGCILGLKGEDHSSSEPYVPLHPPIWGIQGIQQHIGERVLDSATIVFWKWIMPTKGI